jgi:Protein of unknown function (DUF1592)/Protein of unknown function (DUF1588)/Protein of unknown function (DUF1595)
MRTWWLWSAATLVACTSTSDDFGAGAPAGKPGPDVPAGVTLDAAPTSLHPLTPDQYRNTVRDLLGLADADVAAIKIPTDEGGIPSLLTVSKLDDAATQLTALGAHKKLVGCDVAGAGSADCATKFITDFGTKAFRHAITPDEVAWLTGIYNQAHQSFSFADSIDVLARVVLQSPQVVYVHEEGEARPGLPDGVLGLTPYETASRLSYFLWDSMPDDALFAAAAQNQLTGDGLKAQATRMIADPRARAKIIGFVTTWTELDGTARHVSIEEAVKDPTRFPLDNAALRAAVRRETQEFVGKVWDNGAKVTDLFTSTDAYVNGPLAKLYGLPSGPAGDAWQWTTLPAAQRAGLATRAAFLLVYANPDIPSPIRRGSAVWREFMCTTFPPPPPAAMDVKVSGGETDSAGHPLSIRDTVVAKTTLDPICSSCHNKVNPAGFPFGHYDALGQWQDKENGVSPAGVAYSAPIDASGELVGSDVAGPVDGAVQFSAKLAASRQVKDCLASRYWRAAFARDTATQEVTSLKYVQDRLASSGSFKDALLALVDSPAFQYMRKGTP